MSVKGDIFRQLSTYLMATLQTYDAVNNPNGVFKPEMGLPGLKWVDKQMGQFNHPELAQLVPLPAILIGFRKTNWESESRRVQKGDSILTFWVYYENYADSFTGSMNQDIALKFFDYNEEVHKALQGYDGDTFTKLDRISDEDDEDQDMIIGTIFEYSTLISDFSADEHRHYAVIENTNATPHYVEQIIRPPRYDGDNDDKDNDFII
jgi:hypothetical protein